MSSFNSIMDTSLSGMFLARVALQTVSHNIANANTPGFSRQDVVLSARRPLQMAYGTLGRGAQIEQVRRLTDAFLLEKHRSQTARLAGYEQLDGALGEVEAIFGSTDNDHLGTSLNAFFNAWSDLATPPVNQALKQGVASAARALATDLRATAAALTELERSLNDGIARELQDVNALLRQVAALNGQVLQSESQGGNANDLRDQRDQLLVQLSRLTRVSVLEREDGTLDVVLKGRTVVTRAHAEQLVLQRVMDGQGERAQIVTQANHGPVEMDEGKLQGMIAARDGHVRGARERLDALARLLIDRVNHLHGQGQTARGAGLLFFTGDSAATIALSTALEQDPDLIATSRSGLPGDNDLALAIAALATQPLVEGSAETLLDRYNGLIIDLASQRGSAQFLLQNQQNVVETILSRLESVRGVSLDEEGANLLRFQHAYEASARVVTAAAEMFKTLLEMV